nr:MAG TPA: IrrE protein [Caudoviricetes sp.]
MSDDSNRKQELRARLWGYNKLIGLHGIISCYKTGCQTAYDMAEHLGVTEEFLLEALQCYRNKYGVCIKFDNYVIYFEPRLSVLELI